MDFEANDFKEVFTRWIEVEHSDKRCWSGIRSLKLHYPGLAVGDFVRGGTCTDCELKEDRLFVFRARVFHEWEERDYFVTTKAVIRDEDEVAAVFKGGTKIAAELVKDLEAKEGGGQGGGEVVKTEITEMKSANEPLVITTRKKFKSKPPTSFARIGVWDKKDCKVWSKKEAAGEVPLNEWHTIEVQMIGTSSGRGKIFIHLEEGFQGNLFIDDVEVIWGGPTETERLVDQVVNACKIEHVSHARKVRRNKESAAAKCVLLFVLTRAINCKDDHWPL